MAFINKSNPADSGTEPVILFATPPPLDSLRGLTIYLNDYSQFSQLASKLQPQVIKCREFIFTEPEVIGTPSPDIKQSSFNLVAKCSFWKTGRLLSRLEKMGLEVSKLYPVTPALYQACLKYTLLARIAPSWNKAGPWLIQGREFLTISGYANAVKMDLMVNENELFFTLEATAVKFTPLKVSDLDIVGTGLKQFLENPQAEIPHHSIASDWCFVLPSMKKGRIVSISHDIPEESIFRSYRDLKRHWKNTYGYRLPESEEDMNFYQVQFGPLGGRLFTYPEACLRSREIQRVPRIDPKPILRAFIQEIQARFPTICECPMKLQSKAKFVISVLNESCKVSGTTKANLVNRMITSRPALYRSKVEVDKMLSKSSQSVGNSAQSQTRILKTPNAIVANTAPIGQLSNIAINSKTVNQTESVCRSSVSNKSNTPVLEKKQLANTVLSAAHEQTLGPDLQGNAVVSKTQQPSCQSRIETPVKSPQSLFESPVPQTVRKIFPVFKPKKALFTQPGANQQTGATSQCRAVPMFSSKKKIQSVCDETEQKAKVTWPANAGNKRKRRAETSSEKVAKTKNLRTAAR